MSEEVPSYIDMWYDKHLKLWTLQVKDKYNNQIGKSEYVTGKKNALKEKEELEQKYNLKV